MTRAGKAVLTLVVATAVAAVAVAGSGAAPQQAGTVTIGYAYDSNGRWRRSTDRRSRQRATGSRR